MSLASRLRATWTTLMLPRQGAANTAGTAARTAFVLACPRSGTTWLKCALNAHPQVLCVERRLFGMYCDLIRNTGSDQPQLRITADRYVSAIAPVIHGGDLPISVAALSSELLSHLVTHTETALLGASGKTLLVDKVTPYAATEEAVVAGIRSYCPNAPIIHLVRDGRDVVTSGVFHWLSKEAAHEAPNAIRAQRKAFFLRQGSESHLERFFSEDDLVNWCGMWVTALAAAERLRASHSVLTVRYEEMIDDMRVVLARILEFLDVDRSAAVIDRAARTSSFESMSGGRARGQELVTAHVRKGIVGDWRRYFTRRDGEVFAELAGRHLYELGFESGPEWIESLPARLDLSR